MQFAAKKITLKDGRTAVLRSPTGEDAEQLLQFIRQSSGETEFLLRYPEERDITVGHEAERANNLLAAPNTMGIACFADGRAVGNAEIRYRPGIKTGHRATIAIAVLRDYWGQGIGSALMEVLIDTARRWGMEFLELAYIAGNRRARRLYERFGFQEVSQRPNVFKRRDGSYQDEIYMQKYL